MILQPSHEFRPLVIADVLGTAFPGHCPQGSFLAGVEKLAGDRPETFYPMPGTCFAIAAEPVPAELPPERIQAESA